MGEGFARNPANGFQGFLDSLARMEGTALEGIRLSVDEERAIGRKAREEYLRRAEARGYRVARDAKDQAYVGEIVTGMAAHMRQRARYPRIEVTLLEADVPDGQTFPGGYLVLTTAVLREPDEATVAGIVAHELAHLDRGHMYDYARRSKLAEATYGRGPGNTPGDFDRFFARQTALLGLMMNPFRPEHEAEADCLATTWLYLEDYDPGALVEFFERLHRRLGDAPDAVFSFGRSHPYSLARRDAVRARLRVLERWRRRDPGGRYAENLRDRSSKFAAE